MHLVIYGSEGSGKGTQAKLLSELLDLPVYTSGNLVREIAAKDKGSIGEVCRNALKYGKYVSDEEMFLIWSKTLKGKEAKKGFILDGFSRTLNQAKFLLENTAKYGYRINKVIYLKISDKEALARLGARNRKLYEGSTLSHDTPERIKQRLKMYHKQEKELTDFFRSQNLLLEVDGVKPVEEVFLSILKGLKVVAPAPESPTL